MTDPKPGQSSKPPGALVRALGKSKRLQYLLKLIVEDASLPANPLAWLPILIRGPRPLSAAVLREAVRSWSRRRFRGTGCEIAVHAVDSPPPLLDDGGEGMREGVAVEVRCADGLRVACFHAWFAADGTRGAYAVFEVGDAEIATMPLDPAADESGAIGRLDLIARRYIDGQLMAPAFEEWLEGYTSGWRWIEPPVASAVVEYQGGDAWRYALVPRDGGETVIGLSAVDSIGTVQVGVFFAGRQGVLSSQHHVGRTKSPAGLRALLAENFGKSADDTVLAGWILHRVVPPLQPAK